MEKLNWSVGRNLVIDYRWGAFNVERARVIAAELLNLAPDVIVSGGTPGALAFQQITRTVPIVFAVVTEPVTQGIVQSLAHPGGNEGFSLLRCISPLVALTAIRYGAQNSVAIGGTFDITGLEPLGGSIQNDPSAILAVHCGNGFDAGFSPYQSTRLSPYNAVS
jgi:hypothetical protein